MHMNMIAMQRASLVKTVGLQARDLYREGYGVDADRLLDTLNEQRATWDDGQDGRFAQDEVVRVQESVNAGLAGGTLKSTIVGKDVIL